ncbi:MAG: alpha/beta hydrolase [Chloroflexota bacterium]|jgi:acetyl esterase
MQERHGQRPRYQTARGKLRAVSSAQSAQMVTLDPTTEAFVEGLEAQGGPPLYTLSPTDARQVLLDVQSSVPVTLQQADIKDLTIPGGPTGHVSLRIVRPAGVAGQLPAVIYIHGGGWVLGDKQTHDRLIREIANGAQVAVVFVDYTRSPEAHYPVAIEQAYAATKWAVEQGAQVALDTSHLVVAGDSVGGNMTAAVTLLAKERGGPQIAYQMLFYPVTDANFDTSSYQQFADGPWLTREAMKWFWDAYAPDAAVRAEPTASPLRAPIEQLAGLPPALITTNEADVLRDEGEAYAHRLMEAGVRVTAIRYLGTIHDMMLLNPIANTPAPRAAIAEATAALRQLLHHYQP